MAKVEEVNMTVIVDRLCDGECAPTEQKVCGIILRELLTAEKPVVYGREYRCALCDQPINQKKKDGKFISVYCKVCGKRIDWDGIGEALDWCEEGE